MMMRSGGNKGPNFLVTPIPQDKAGETMKTLKTFEFKPGVGQRSTYDWDAILSGQPVQLEAGVDYQCKSQTLTMMARKQAEKRGMTVKTAKVEGGVVIQAFHAEANGETSRPPAPKKKASKKVEAE